MELKNFPSLFFNKKMAFLWFLFLNTLCSLSITNAELIDSLPGQPSGVTFKQYSGYIVTDDHHGRALFYYFAEAQSQSKLSMPLTLWLGGGVQGCSCAGVGVFYEHGPFRVGEDGSLIMNEFSWNLVSNMLYIDTPIGSAFSYSNTSSDYKIWSDPMTAKENFKFLLKWYKKFPQYRDLDFYLAGDSYGGHFAPQLAGLIVYYNKKTVNVKPIKLKGIALGNPLLDGTITVDRADNLWYRGIISEELHTLQKKCDYYNYTRLVPGDDVGKSSKDCSKLVSMTYKELGQGLEMGDMLLPSCIYSNSDEEKLASERSIIGGDPCLRDRVDIYLNNSEVQKALHVNTAHLPFPWDSTCKWMTTTDHDVFFNMLPILSALIERDIPILIYSGDQDLMFPVTQTRILVTALARNATLITLHSNGPWYNGLQIGGWSQSFGKMRKGKKVTYLTFATVRGGAHFVPFSSPSEAFTLFKKFLKGSPPHT